MLRVRLDGTPEPSGKQCPTAGAWYAAERRAAIVMNEDMFWMCCFQSLLLRVL